MVSAGPACCPGQNSRRARLLQPPAPPAKALPVSPAGRAPGSALGLPGTHGLALKTTAGTGARGEGRGRSERTPSSAGRSARPAPGPGLDTQPPDRRRVRLTGRRAPPQGPERNPGTAPAGSAGRLRSRPTPPPVRGNGRLSWTLRGGGAGGGGARPPEGGGRGWCPGGAWGQRPSGRGEGRARSAASRRRLQSAGQQPPLTRTPGCGACSHPPGRVACGELAAPTPADTPGRAEGSGVRQERERRAPVPRGLGTRRSGPALASAPAEDRPLTTVGAVLSTEGPKGAGGNRVHSLRQQKAWGHGPSAVLSWS